MNRQGVALFMAMVALLLAGALATVVLAAARLRWLSGYRQLAARQAYEAAAGAVGRHVAEWDSVVTSDLVPGIVAPLAGPDLPGSIRTHDSVIRLGAHLFLLRSVGEAITADGSVLARDGVAQLIELQTADPPERTSSAALTEAMRVSAYCHYTIRVVGPEQSLPEWGDCRSGSGMPRVELEREAGRSPTAGSWGRSGFRTHTLPVVRGWWRWP